MDISKLSHGIKVVLGGSIAFLIVSIFNWQEIDLGVVSGGVSMWNGWGVLAGLLAIVIVVWEGLRLANVKLEIGLTPAMVTSALAILLLFFTILKFLVSNEFRTVWAWIGLLLAVFVAVGAFMNMKELGHSFEDMGNEMKAAAGSAAAAAKAATDKDDAAPAPQIGRAHV
jgi:cation transport ATPase